MPSPPLLAESHRFSMIFFLSSGCCSSLRWKKEYRQEEGWEAESGVQGEEVAHMNGVEMDVKCGQDLSLEPNVSVMKCARNRTTCARSFAVLRKR